MADRDPSIDRFNRICFLVACAWLVLITAISFALRPTDQDFPIYYAAGKAARLGAWDALYPVPRHDAAELQWGPDTLKPQTVALTGSSHGSYIQPVWNAVFLAPLSLLPYRAAQVGWLTLLVFCTCGVAWCAMRSLRMCAGAPSKLEGIVALVFAISPLAYRTIRVQNTSGVIGFCIGISVLSMIQRDGWRSGLPIWIAGVLKAPGGAVLLLALLARRWRTIAWVVLLGAALLGLSLALAGMSPMREYADVASDIWKSTRDAGNQSVYGLTLRLGFATDGIRELGIAVQLVVLFLIALRWRDDWRSPRLMFPGAVAILAALMIFSPLFWEHYFVYFVPFWGWLAWEATQSKLRMIVAVLAAALTYLPPPALARFPEPVQSRMLFGAVLMLLLALDRLIRRHTPKPPPDEIH